MSVYKDAFHALARIANKSEQIFPDACDYGAPTKQGDQLWSDAAYLAGFGEPSDRKEDRYSTGRSVETVVRLMDEWETGEELNYGLSFVSCTTGKCKGFDGYFTVTARYREEQAMLNSFKRKS